MQRTLGISLLVLVVIGIGFMASRQQASAPVVPGIETGTVEEGAVPPASEEAPAATAPVSSEKKTAPAAAGSSSSGAVEVSVTGSASVTAPAPVAATIKGYAYLPGTITVKKGTKVTWTNQDPARHTVSFDSMAVESPFLAAGESFSYTFDKPGTYPYHCSPHPYMKATVVVTE